MKCRWLLSCASVLLMWLVTCLDWMCVRWVKISSFVDDTWSSQFLVIILPATARLGRGYLGCSNNSWSMTGNRVAYGELSSVHFLSISFSRVPRCSNMSVAYLLVVSSVTNFWSGCRLSSLPAFLYLSRKSAKRLWGFGWVTLVLLVLEWSSLIGSSCVLSWECFRLHMFGWFQYVRWIRVLVCALFWIFVWYRVLCIRLLL